MAPILEGPPFPPSLAGPGGGLKGGRQLRASASTAPTISGRPNGRAVRHPARRGASSASETRAPMSRPRNTPASRIPPEPAQQQPEQSQEFHVAEPGGRGP